MTDTVHEPLLVVEDSNEDFNILQRLMRRMEVRNPIYRCSNGDEALNYLYRQGMYNNPDDAPRPSVILLDLNLPGLDGRDVLERLKQDTTFREIPIVVFTTSSSPKDVKLCYQKGANGYLIKPMDYKELQNIMRAFVDYWLEVNVTPVENRELGIANCESGIVNRESKIVNRESKIVNRESGIGNQELGIGNWELGIGNCKQILD